MDFNYLFGPVLSRRFGRSLGIDLLGQRVCSFNCVFCEAGPTQTCTLRRDAYVPLDLVLGELRAWLGSGGTADVVTLAGRGEPTLHTGFGAVIDAVHAMCDIPVVLLSNGSLMWMPEVRRDAARADIVKISLGGWDDRSFGRLNQPAEGLPFEKYLSGLIALRAAFAGELRLEVMLVQGVNDAEAVVRDIAACAALIKADKVELNTVARPPADKHAVAVPVAMLERYAAFFVPRAVVIGRGAAPQDRAVMASEGDVGAKIVALLERRGCALEEIAQGIGLPRHEVERCLHDMVAKGTVSRGQGNVPYFCLVASM